MKQKHKYFRKRIFSIPWKQFKNLFHRKHETHQHPTYPLTQVCKILLENRMYGDKKTRNAIRDYLQNSDEPRDEPQDEPHITSNESPLDTAIYFNFPLCFKYLLDSGCPYNRYHVQTMLYQVTLYCQWEIMTTMIRTNMVYPGDVQNILDDESIGLNRRYVLWRNFQYWIQDQTSMVKEIPLKNRYLIPRIMEYLGSDVGKNMSYCSCVVISAKALVK